MNKNIRLVVSVLFIVIIILAVGLTRFYFDVSKDAGSNGSTEEIIRRLDSDENGNRIFEGSNGLYGIINAEDKVIVEPEWTELSFAGTENCIASKRIGGRILSGCINYDGDITVPFIYRNITAHSSEKFDFYTAETDSDGSCVIYDSRFIPCFTRAWEEYSFRDDELVLKSGSSELSYDLGENGFTCKKAVLKGQVLENDYELRLISRILLSELSCDKLELISEASADYLEFAYTGNAEKLMALTGNQVANSFFMLFPDEERITRRKLLGISDIFIYSEKNDAGEQYYSVSVVADTEITYRDSEGNFRTLTDECKAIVRFASSDTSVRPVSGSFIKETPDYPDSEESVTEETTDTPASE